MTDDEQDATWCHRRRQLAVEHLTLVLRQVQELRRHKVIGSRGRDPFGEVRVQPGDAFRDVGADLEGLDGAAFQGDRGDVDCGDPPALLGQKDGVCTLPTTDIQRYPGREVRYLGDEVGVDVPAPQVAAGLVPLVPEGFARDDLCWTVLMVIVAVMSASLMGSRHLRSRPPWAARARSWPALRR